MNLRKIGLQFVFNKKNMNFTNLIYEVGHIATYAYKNISYLNKGKRKKSFVTTCAPEVFVLFMCQFNTSYKY